MTDDILEFVSQISTPGFFVTSDIIYSSQELPEGIDFFITQKLNSIKKGTKARKFAFRDSGWQINFTFYPTDEVVDKRYAMMNKMIKLQKKNI